MKSIKLLPCLAVAACLALGSAAGCTKKPDQNDVAKLEEAKNAAETANKKLSDLKQERMRLEAQKDKQGDQKKDDDK
jgi:hypothetical protein